ncbi:PEP-CTERM sorting domain-containing protein [Coleofasciculus chthonoplastes]|uniref:PEP-CTERM sorting domain-containing protein n=1 Tax=Coleofasciculus chthonoplastes TaxID=64178 RepID=UPI0033033590
MKFSSLVPSVLAAAGVAVASSAFAPAQAALLNGAGTCDLSNFTTYTDCGGFFDGNGNQVGDDNEPLVGGNDDASDIGEIFGGLWEQVSKVESGTTSGVLTVNSLGQTSGTWSVSGIGDLSGYVAVIKAGNSFSAYKLGSATSGNWDTLGVEPVGGGNTPGLSHFTLYKPVPEPLTILGSATALGIGGLLKRQQSKKNNKNKA